MSDSEDFGTPVNLPLSREQASCLLALLEVELQMAPLRAQACEAFGYPDRYAVLVFADEFRGIAQKLREQTS